MVAKIKAVWAIIVAELKDIWNRGKMVILALLALVGVIEFKKIQEFILQYLAQKEMNSANKKDQTLASAENTANNQANQLIADANALPVQEGVVTEDWNKKK